MTFSRDIRIRFQHCDPAGIVFYPRYFEMLNQIVEDWFADELGMPFQEMHLKLGLGVPAVRIDCEFLSASRIGDVLTFELWARAIGKRSISLEIAAQMDDDIRLRA